MKLLVVEGNNEETWTKRGKYGIMPYHQLFAEMLHFLVPHTQVDTAFPADGTKDLPNLVRLRKYDGILWTGSALSVTDNIPSVTRQLDFAQTVFESGVPFYGSCWGLQVATVVAGGKVGKSVNGLEFGISETIQLTTEGRASSFFSERPSNFKALCIHYDEVVQLPNNSTVLAKNAHSPVQAVTFDYKKSNFFGVQYHPEFNPEQIGLIASFLEDKLVASGAFASNDEVRTFVKNLSPETGLPSEISDYKIHTQEIGAWLRQVNN